MSKSAADASSFVRCTGCRLAEEACICSSLPKLKLSTRVMLVIHRREQFRSTNTGVLATQCLVNSEVFHHAGSISEGPSAFPENSYLLFPDEKAQLLDDIVEDLPRPVTLVVPDGTWRQARRMRSRIPALRHLPRIRLAPTSTSRYLLRKSAHDHYLATAEAIAEALRLLESDQVGQTLKNAFVRFVREFMTSPGRHTKKALTPKKAL